MFRDAECGAEGSRFESYQIYLSNFPIAFINGLANIFNLLLQLCTARALWSILVRWLVPFWSLLCRFTTQVVTSERHVRRRGGTEGGCGGGVSGAELANNRTDVSSELMGVELVVGH